MTILVGIRCSNGVVIGSDSSATFSNGVSYTIEQETKKITLIDNKIIVAGTGAVGLNQRFTHEIQKGWKEKAFSDKKPIEAAAEMSRRAIANFQSTFIQTPQYGALVAFPCDKGLQLCEFDPASFQPELKTDHLWYASMGSGQGIADPFLGFIRKIFWKDGMPTLQDAIFLAVWTIQQTINLNAGGINGPIQMAVLRKDGETVSAELLDENSLAEHSQHVGEIEQHIGRFWEEARVISDDESTIPIPPI